MGRHEHSLKLYAYKLANFRKAEAYDRHRHPRAPITYCLLRYCRRVYHPDTETVTMFLALPNLCLRPTTKHRPNLPPR
ncbi:hypothetical protein EDD17DRAFT_885528 [Pisolithus thermaeus]|nr:hypothetical protein EV401DRAFT_1626997 [Pisolithus croceorrhizus]KAI6159806.1 hypothetical protein EDD17DRAFT_885528 [Pisolithus thermaeus]